MEQFIDYLGRDISNLYIQASLGHIPGARPIFVHGYSEEIETTETVVWPLGGAIADTGLFPTNPVATVYIKSDTLLGGVTPEAIELKVCYIDGNRDEVTAYVTTPATLTNVLHIIQAECTTANSVGDIYFSSVDFVPPLVPTLANTMGFVSAVDGISTTAICVVPRDHVAIILGFSGGTSKGELVRVIGKYRKHNGTTGAWLSSPSLMTFESTSILGIPAFLLNEHSDFVITAKGTSGTAPQDTTVTGILVPKRFVSPEVLAELDHA